MRTPLRRVGAGETGGSTIFNPGAELVFQPADTLIVMGRLEYIDRFRQEYKL